MRDEPSQLSYHPVQKSSLSSTGMCKLNPFGTEFNGRLEAAVQNNYSNGPRIFQSFPSCSFRSEIALSAETFFRCMTSATLTDPLAR